MKIIEQAAVIRKFGMEIVQGVIVVGHKYCELCYYIRANKVPPTLVAFELGRLGFKRQRISEINRVAQAPDEVFAAFQAHYIGFYKCLDLVVGDSRDGWRESEAAKVMVAAGILSNEELARQIENHKRYLEFERKLRGKGVQAELKRAAHILAAKSLGPAEYRFPGARFMVSVRLRSQYAPALQVAPEQGGVGFSVLTESC